VTTGLADARRHLLNAEPYFSHIVYELVPIFTEEVATLAVSESMLLFINPTFFSQRPLPERSFLLWHEVMHVSTTFAARAVLGEGVNHHILNLAADAYINSVGRSLGKALVEGVILPETLGLPPHLGTLEYYKLLLQQGGSAAPCSGCGGGECTAAPELESRYSKEGKGRSVVKSALGRVAKAIPTRDRGLYGGHMEHLADLCGETSTLSWQELLKHSLRGELSRLRGHDGFTYSRPHRRSFIDDEVILPAGIAERSVFTILVDTSGSMHSNLLKACCREAAAAMDDVGLDICSLHQADVALVSSEEVTPEALRNAGFSWRGRGGTCFSWPIQQLIARGEEIGLLLYLTDGYGDKVEYTPFPIVWGLFTDADPPGPGTVVRIKG